MEKQKFIKALINFKEAHHQLLSAFEDMEYDDIPAADEQYPFHLDLMELTIVDWVDEMVRLMGVDRKKILIEILTYLEERNWQYSITHEDRLQLYLGNRFIDISKHDTKRLEELLEELKNW